MKRLKILGMTAALLILLPGLLFSANSLRAGIAGPNSIKAIDTLTLTDDAPLIAAAPNVKKIGFDSLDNFTPQQVRDFIVTKANLDSSVFALYPFGTAQFIVRAKLASNVVIRLNGTVLPLEPSFVTSFAGQNFFLVKIINAPSLTPFALFGLTLLLAGTALWMYRKRAPRAV